MKNIIAISLFLSLLFSQYEIEGRWHLVGYEESVMYQFVDNEPYAEAGLRYSIYSIDGNFGDLEDAGGTPNPYSISGDTITMDLFFGNIVTYQLNYICSGEVVELNDMINGGTHSILFREGYNYNECEQSLEDCCTEVESATENCVGLGCYIPQCTDECMWEPMQCWGSTGYCWCVDIEGNEIDGTSMPSWQGFPDCEVHLEDCFDFTGIDFGECDMSLGVGFLNNECNYVSGCDWIVDDFDYSNLFFETINECQDHCNDSQCQDGYVEINNLCFHEGDISVIQLMLDNSYASGIDLDCQGQYCGSPNPFMDSPDNWGWIAYDGITYEMSGDSNGVVDPLELGIQQWENGRLTSFMCGAYIYCQLSGPIPQEINNLTELETFRVEGNYFSGFIPESICDLNINYNDYLAFDLSYNHLCPPYPSCIDTEDGFWGQYDEDCYQVGDVTYDGFINIFDIVSLVSIILDGAIPDYQILIVSDINADGSLDVIDIVGLVNIILNR